jgi:Mg-chelatase subunit ChlD
VNHPVYGRASGRPGKTRGGIIFLLIALGILIARCKSRDAQDSEDQAAAAQFASEAKYQKTGDEGLGAAVAIVIDNSGSMGESAGGDSRPKYEVAREAVAQMLAATDSFVISRPDFPIKVGLYRFASGVTRVVDIQPYDRETLRTALAGMPPPNGATAIGEALDAARADLYRAGVIRKYILVITDGENTQGRSPENVAREIARRSEGAVRMYFVAFDVDADKFAFVRGVRGEVLGASNGVALRASLDTIYRGKILAEAMDAGERLAPSTDSSRNLRTSSDSSRAKKR